jgi:hypothetical protein
MNNQKTHQTLLESSLLQAIQIPARLHAVSLDSSYPHCIFIKSLIDVVERCQRVSFSDYFRGEMYGYLNSAFYILEGEELEAVRKLRYDLDSVFYSAVVATSSPDSAVLENAVVETVQGTTIRYLPATHTFSQPPRLSGFYFPIFCSCEIEECLMGEYCQKFVGG